MSIRHLITVFALAAAALSTPRAAAAQKSGFQVVVSNASAVTSISVRELSRIFRRELSRWPDGSEVVPLDQKVTSSTREAFTRRIFGRTPVAMQAWWQQQIFSGRSIPPIERPTDGEVLSYVATHPGAIGYVSADASIPSNVRVVTVQ